MRKNRNDALARVARAIEHATRLAQVETATRAGNDRRRAQLDEKRRGLDETRRLVYIAKIRLARGEELPAELAATLTNALTHHHPELALLNPVTAEDIALLDIDATIAGLSEAVDEMNRLYEGVGLTSLLYRGTWPAQAWSWQQ